MIVVVVESRPNISRLSTTTTTVQPPTDQPESNEIDDDQQQSCKTIALPLRQNVSVCNVMTDGKFPYGCFMMKFSFGFTTAVCFTPNNDDDGNSDKERGGECVRLDWPLYHLDGQICLSYTWGVPGIF